jgi:hypothetical protein
VFLPVGLDPFASPGSDPEGSLGLGFGVDDHSLLGGGDQPEACWYYDFDSPDMSNNFLPPLHEGSNDAWTVDLALQVRGMMIMIMIMVL